jgi:hypothetical protein
MLIPNTPLIDYGSKDCIDGGQQLTASKPSTPRTEGNHGSSGPSPNPVAPSRRITRAQLRQAVDALKGKGKIKIPKQLQILSLEEVEEEFT